MGLTEAVSVCFHKYFQFSGRASRSEFWWWTCAVVIMTLMVITVDISVFGVESDTQPVSHVFYLAIFFPDVSVSLRRLQDVGINPIPWLFLFLGFGLWTLAGMIAYYSGLMPDWFRTNLFDTLLWVELAVFGISLIISLFPSQPGTNKYGPNPHEVPA